MRKFGVLRSGSTFVYKQHAKPNHIQPSASKTQVPGTFFDTRNPLPGPDQGQALRGDPTTGGFWAPDGRQQEAPDGRQSGAGIPSSFLVMRSVPKGPC